MYALFDCDKQIGSAFPTGKEVWEAEMIERLVTDVPVADEEGGQIVHRSPRPRCRLRATAQSRRRNNSRSPWR